MSAAMKKIDLDAITRRVAQEIRDGAYINLGIGAPTRVANFLLEDREIVLHSENGLLAMGPAPGETEIDTDLTNAGKPPVTALKGAAILNGLLRVHLRPDLFFDFGGRLGLDQGGHKGLPVWKD